MFSSNKNIEIGHTLDQKTFFFYVGNTGLFFHAKLKNKIYQNDDNEYNWVMHYTPDDNTQPIYENRIEYAKRFIYSFYEFILWARNLDSINFPYIIKCEKTNSTIYRALTSLFGKYSDFIKCEKVKKDQFTEVLYTLEIDFYHLVQDEKLLYRFKKVHDNYILHS